MLDITIFAQSSPLLWGIAAALFVLLAVHFTVGTRLFRPMRGTLEWIQRVDRPRLHFGYAPETLDGWDVLYVFLIAAAAVGCCTIVPMTLLRAQPGVGWMDVADVLLRYFLAPVVSSSMVYLIGRRMTDMSGVALIAAALLLFNYAAARSYSAPFMLTALAALQEYRRKERFSWLVLTAAAIGVGTYVSPEILWFGLVLWLPPLALEILRFAKFGRAAVVPYLLPVLLGLPLMTALFALLTQVPGMVVAWQHPIPRYTVEYFWRLRLKMWKELLTLPTGELPQMGFVDPLLLLYGLGAAVSTLPFAIRTRDLLLQTLIWYFAGNTALWALGVSIPAVGCLPLMVCVWDYWGQREGTLNATIGAIFLLCAAVAGRVLLFLSGM